MDREGYLVGLILLGYPLQQTFAHFFIREKSPDFAEMSLHHIAHVALTSTYLFGNMIPLGILIMFIHDASDVLISVTKVFHLMNRNNIAYFPLVLCVFTWFFGRLVCLPMYLMEIWQYGVYAEGREHLQPYIALSLVFLCTLLLLHVYWFILLLLMIYMALMGTPKDLQNDVT